MTESQITYFLAVAKNLSFSRAAQQYYVSQPAVSKQISLLEDELGFPLFDRAKKGVTLTNAGQLIYQTLSTFQVNFQATLEEARALNASRHGSVRIGCLAGWNPEHFYPLMTRFFAERYPQLELQLEGYDQDSLLAALRRGEVDVVIATENRLKGADLETHPLTTCMSCLFYSSHNPLAGKPNLSLADFKDETFYVVATQTENVQWQTVMNQCQAAGFEPNIAISPSLPAIDVKMQSGKGVMIADSWMIIATNPLFLRLPLDLTYNVNLCWLSDMNNSAKFVFINELLFYYRQHDGKPSLPPEGKKL